MDIHNCILGNRIAYWNYCNLLYGNILGIHLPFTHALKAFDKVKMAARQEVLGVAGEALQAMLIDDDFEDVLRTNSSQIERGDVNVLKKVGSIFV